MTTATNTATRNPVGKSLRANPAYKAAAAADWKKADAQIRAGRLDLALECALSAPAAKLVGMRFTPRAVVLRACGFSPIGEPQVIYGGNNATYVSGHHQAWSHRSGWKTNPVRR